MGPGAENTRGSIDTGDLQRVLHIGPGISAPIEDMDKNGLRAGEDGDGVVQRGILDVRTRADVVIQAWAAEIGRAPTRLVAASSQLNSVGIGELQNRIERITVKYCFAKVSTWTA